jgi:hypothetical protein
VDLNLGVGGWAGRGDGRREGARRRWEIELDGRIERKLGFGEDRFFFGHVGENSNALACNCCLLIHPVFDSSTAPFGVGLGTDVESN